jgi:hypothetical protein
MLALGGPKKQEKFDMQSLKKLMLRVSFQIYNLLKSYELSQFELREIQSTMRWTQEKYLISRKYFEIY